MDKMQTNNGELNPTTKHFSHPHTLNLINYQSIQSFNNNRALILCSCCNLTLSSNSWVYCCTPCGYFLHLSCSKMPPKITHPSCSSSGGRHVLKLHPKPDTAIHPNGAFKCAACLKDDDCFSYRCDPCGADLHAACASSPLTLRHRSHPHHDLRLAFSPPYPNQTFSCGACRRIGVKGWLYRCGGCAFDLHFECAKACPPPTQSSTANTQNDVNQRFSQYVLRNHPQMMGANVLRPPYNNVNNNISYGFPTNNNNNLANLLRQQQAMQEQAMMRIFMGNYNNANNYQNLVNQMLLQSTVGGGGGVNTMGSGGGLDQGSMSSTDSGAMSGGGFDFGAMAGGGGGDFGTMAGGGAFDFGAMAGGGFDFSSFGLS